MIDTPPPAGVAGDTWVATLDGAVPVADLAPGARPGSWAEVDVKLVGLHGTPVRGTAVRHAGTHPVLAVVAGERELRCTSGQLLLTRVVVAGVPRLAWTPAGELAVGDLIAVAEPGPATAVAAGPGTEVAVVEPAREVPGAPEIGFFGWVAVELVAALGAQPVHTVGVDAPDHAYVTDGFVSAGFRSPERNVLA